MQPLLEVAPFSPYGLVAAGYTRADKKDREQQWFWQLAALATRERNKWQKE